MNHFARVDGSNTVIDFIVASQEFIDSGKVGDPDMWILADEYDGGPRLHRPSVGFSYSPEDDVFIPPCPHNGWVLNKTNFTWEPPIPKPREPWIDSDGTYNNYLWDEEKLEWYVHSKPYVDTVALLENPPSV